MEQPYVACVEEYGGSEVAYEVGTQFKVGFQLEVARLVDVGVAAHGAAVAARAYAAGSEAAHGVGSACVEQGRVGAAVLLP